MTAVETEAVLLVAQGRLTIPQIARKLGVGPRTISTWKADPEFQAAVERHEREVAEALKHKYRHGIGSQERRLFRKNDRWHRLLALIAARASDPAMRDVPGGTTGLLVMRERSFKIDKDAYSVVQEFEIDAAVLAELRQLEQDAAIELGEWKQKHEIDGSLDVKLSPPAAKLADLFTPQELEVMRDRLTSRGAAPAAPGEPAQSTPDK